MRYRVRMMNMRKYSTNSIANGPIIELWAKIFLVTVRCKEVVSHEASGESRSKW